MVLAIRVEYKSGTADEYPTDEKNAPKLVSHFLENPNVIKITFERWEEGKD